MIEGVQVENYKSLKEVEADLGDFTILVGPNNSGKTALLEAIMYLKQAVRSSANSANQIGNPEYLDHSLDSDIVFHRADGKQANHIRVTNLIDLSGTEGYEELQDIYDDLNPSVVCPKKLRMGAELTDRGWAPVVTTEDNEPVLKHIDEGESGGDITFRHELDVGETRIYNNGLWNIQFKSGNTGFRNIIRIYKGLLTDTLGEIFYITDNRDISDWESDPVQQDFVGHFGENTVSMLHALRDQPDTFERITQAISDISTDVADLRADMDGANTKTELEDADTKELFNIVASGAGLRRLLPIIVQIGAAESGDTILIEEPEISVYPKTQERLVEFMLESARERDIQIVFTSHGYALTWKVQNMSKPNDGHCLVFEKEDGESMVEKKPLNRIPVEKYYGEE